MFLAYTPIFRSNGCYSFFTYTAYGVLGVAESTQINTQLHQVGKLIHNSNQNARYNYPKFTARTCCDHCNIILVCVCLPSGFLPSGFPTINLCAFLIRACHFPDQMTGSIPDFHFALNFCVHSFLICSCHSEYLNFGMYPVGRM